MHYIALRLHYSYMTRESLVNRLFVKLRPMIYHVQTIIGVILSTLLSKLFNFIHRLNNLSHANVTKKTFPIKGKGLFVIF